METLADFKRAIRVGTKWSGENHIYQSCFGCREVGIVQGNAFAFKMVGSDGEVRHSWCNFPKAKDIAFRDDGTVEIFVNGTLFLTYKEVK